MQTELYLPAFDGSDVWFLGILQQSVEVFPADYLHELDFYYDFSSDNGYISIEFIIVPLDTPDFPAYGQMFIKDNPILFGPGSYL